MYVGGRVFKKSGGVYDATPHGEYVNNVHVCFVLNVYCLSMYSSLPLMSNGESVLCVLGFGN